MRHSVCGGPLAFLGALGNVNHYRCVDCGADVSRRRPGRPHYYAAVYRAPNGSTEAADCVPGHGGASVVPTFYAFRDQKTRAEWVSLSPDDLRYREPGYRERVPASSRLLRRALERGEVIGGRDAHYAPK